MIDIIEYCKYYNEKPFEEIEKPSLKVKIWKKM